MMNAAINKIIHAIASDVHLLIRQVFVENSLKDTALLHDMQLTVSAANNPVIEVIFSDYVEYIEKGRVPGGKQPPIDALRDWALKHSIPTDNQTLWLIARSIKNRGTAPRPILANLEKYVEESFENKWSGILFDTITDEVAKYYFKD